MPKASPVIVPSVAEIEARLRDLALPAFHKVYVKQGVGDRVFGVKMGDLRAMAKPWKKQHALGLALWAAGWYETRVLATMALDAKQLTAAEAVRMVEECDSAAILDKLVDDVVAETPMAAELRARWLDLDEPLLGRAGWRLMIDAVQKDRAGAMDLAALMAKIEAELPAAPRPKKEAMNQCLVMIGVYHPAFTEAAIAAGERLGRWDDRPVPKGCYSSYPPEWIPAAIRLRRR